MGRKKIELDIKEIERLAGLGLTNEEIALSLGIHVNTLDNRKNEDVVFVDAIKRGRTKANTAVANKLYEKAIDGELGAIIWWEKTRAGRTEKQTFEHTGKDGKPIEHKHDHSISPDLVAAAIAVLEGTEGGSNYSDDPEDTAE